MSGETAIKPHPSEGSIHAVRDCGLYWGSQDNGGGVVITVLMRRSWNDGGGAVFTIVGAIVVLLGCLEKALRTPFK